MTEPETSDNKESEPEDNPELVGTNNHPEKKDKDRDDSKPEADDEPKKDDKEDEVIFKL